MKNIWKELKQLLKSSSKSGRDDGTERQIKLKGIKKTEKLIGESRKITGKEILAIGLTVTMAFGLLTACGKNSTETSGTVTKNIDTLKIMISPYQDADTLLTGLEPLGDMIKTKMKEKGYTIEQVDMTVGTSYTAVGEALSAGTADVGFISGGTYVTYDQDCDVLLTALRQAINKDSENASDWNDGSREVFTDDLTTYYRSIILAGPSEKGQKLKAKVDTGEELTWDDLDSATWAVMGASSASGYIYPGMYLKDHFGKQISDLSHVVQSDSYTTSMARLAAGQVDIVVGYAHLRANMGDNWTGKLGGTDSIYNQTGVLAVTDKILDDTISVSRESSIVDEEFKQAFGETMIEIGESEEGKDALKIMSHKGYQWAQPADYDAERQAQKMLKEN